MPDPRAYRWLVAALVAASGVLTVAHGQRAFGLEPNDPAVQAAVDKGVKFLLTSSAGGTAGDMDLGRHCLASIALLKCDVPPTDPYIRQSADNLRASIKSGAITSGYHSVYNLGVGTVLLSALKDKEGCQAAIKLLLTLQRTHGGFSSGVPGGDTSMTQYAVLGMWEASHVGVAAPPQNWQAVTTWLMQTQTSEGTFIYNPPPPGFGAGPGGLVGGPMVGGATGGHSMTTAGLSTMYICANHIRARNGSTGRENEPRKTNSTDLPSALIPVGGQKNEPAKEQPRAGTIAVDLTKLQAAMTRGDGWLEKNFRVELQGHTYYYLYAIERYYAFRQRWEGKAYRETDWYSQGATFMLSKQQLDGSWSGDEDARITTSFALLFLVQGTKKTLKPPVEEKAGGTLLSGSGLPADLSDVRLKDGQVVLKPLSGPAGELLEIMQRPDDPKFLAAVEGFNELVVKADDAMLSPHLVTLKKLAKSAAPEARVAVIASLGKARNLDLVPLFIYSLRDEDERVIHAAWEALRFTSRRYDTFGLSPKFTGDDKAKALAKAKAIAAWKSWYLSIRPDTDFEE